MKMTEAPMEPTLEPGKSSLVMEMEITSVCLMIDDWVVGRLVRGGGDVREQKVVGEVVGVVAAPTPAPQRKQTDR